MSVLQHPDAQQRPHIAVCHVCQGEMYRYDKAFFVKNNVVCERCFQDIVKAMGYKDTISAATSLNIDWGELE